MRTPQVTRTINSTLVHALCMDLVKGQAYEQDFNLPGILRDERKMLRAIASRVPEGHKPVSIKSAQLVKTLYGMPESTFIEHATLMPPRIKTEKEEN